MQIGPALLNLESAYARLALPTHPSRMSTKPIFIKRHHSFVYGKLSIKETWVTLLIFINLGLGIKLMVSSA